MAEIIDYFIVFLSLDLSLYFNGAQVSKLRENRPTQTLDFLFW